MINQRRMLKTALFATVALFAAVAFPLEAKADSAGDLLTGESSGASIVFNPNAYNDADTESIGLDVIIAEDVIEDYSNLVMANVKKTLYIRAKQSTKSTIVGKLYKDCGGTLIEKGEEWSLIKTGDVTGYCSNEYLLFNEDAIALAKEVGITSAVISADCLAVHETADEDSAVLGYATKDDVFEVIYEQDETWACIAYGDYDGFIMTADVELEFEVDAGESMEAINARKEEEKKQKRARMKQEIYDDHDDLKLLASIIWCEARGEPYEGMLAVGAVVMNRVKSPAYPNTVFGVIFASGQFSPVKRGGIYLAYNKNANAICYQAAQEALNGYTNVGDVTHFRRAGSKQGIVIGHHVFY